MRCIILAGIALLAHGKAFPQGADPAAVDGPVTRFVSLNDFAVSGSKVALRPDTEIRLLWPDGSSVIAKPPVKLFLGEHVAVFQRPGSEIAEKLEIFQPSTHAVDGTATIEAVLSTTDLEVRADGYQIRIGPGTKVTYQKPFTAANDLKPDAILKYKGMLQKDGTVVATSAVFFKDEFNADTLQARKEWEFDPNVVPAESRQSGASRNFRGTDARYFPLHSDAAMQARLSEIGEKLIPEYQKKLGPSDASWIHFRFYVVDGPKNPDASYPLPSGIVLVPYQVVQKMADDSQLAAVLADAIACLIEVQPIALPMTNGQVTKDALKTATQIAGMGVIGTSIVGSSPNAQVRKDAEQRARVSLSLMRDARFDPMAAPKAWWNLSRDESNPTTLTELPPMATYLYRRIAEVEAANMGILVGKKR